MKHIVTQFHVTIKSIDSCDTSPSESLIFVLLYDAILFL